jgi:hypothetical protein
MNIYEPLWDFKYISHSHTYTRVVRTFLSIREKATFNVMVGSSASAAVHYRWLPTYAYECLNTRVILRAGVSEIRGIEEETLHVDFYYDSNAYNVLTATTNIDYLLC